LYEPNGALTCRNRLLWWCCIVRNRLIKLGMRRPKILHMTASPGGIVRATDYGLEALFPKYSPSNVKMRTIAVFIELCKLTDLMQEVMTLTDQIRQSRNGEDLALDKDLGGYGQVISLNRKMSRWSKDYEETMEKTEVHNTVEYNCVPVHYLRVLFHSTVAALYQPYMELVPRGNATNPAIQEVAVHKVKEASSKIASCVGNLLLDAKLEDVPSTIGAWITLPIAVHLVELNTRRGVDGGEPGGEGNGESLSRFGHLLRVLHSLKVRSEGGEWVAQLIDTTIRAMGKQVGKEPELLAYVTGLIDAGLANGLMYSD